MHCYSPVPVQETAPPSPNIECEFVHPILRPYTTVGSPQSAPGCPPSTRATSSASTYPTTEPAHLTSSSFRPCNATRRRSKSRICAVRHS